MIAASWFLTGLLVTALVIGWRLDRAEKRKKRKGRIVDWDRLKTRTRLQDWLPDGVTADSVVGEIIAGCRASIVAGKDSFTYYLRDRDGYVTRLEFPIVLTKVPKE